MLGPPPQRVERAMEAPRGVQRRSNTIRADFQKYMFTPVSSVERCPFLETSLAVLGQSGGRLKSSWSVRETKQAYMLKMYVVRREWRDFGLLGLSWGGLLGLSWSVLGTIFGAIFGVLGSYLSSCGGYTFPFSGLSWPLETSSSRLATADAALNTATRASPSMKGPHRFCRTGVPESIARAPHHPHFPTSTLATTTLTLIGSPLVRLRLKLRTRNPPALHTADARSPGDPVVSERPASPPRQASHTAAARSPDVLTVPKCPRRILRTEAARSPGDPHATAATSPGDLMIHDNTIKLKYQK